MNDHGITVLRFGVQEIDNNLAGVIDTIRNEIWLLKGKGAVQGES